MPVARINETYRRLFSIRLGRPGALQNRLTPGLITIIVYAGNETITIKGTYNGDNGLLSGLAQLYRLGYLDNREEVAFQIRDQNTIEIAFQVAEVGQNQAQVNLMEREQTVFERRHLNHIHIEPFRPENLRNWFPRTEPDIYMIFGVLEEYTDFKYCCGTNMDLLRQLGYQTEENAKPDAILISRTTGEYLIAEFKLRSSQFFQNHDRDDIDVLVVWENDVNEEGRNELPNHIVVLSEIARTAAVDNFAADE
ncbi:MAG: hypothetical protein GYA35_00400 [Thermoanaerobaculaceae bacterium]|nr:hypothetical protein [Thermoanaerobaculaceae bacterium]